MSTVTISPEAQTRPAATPGGVPYIGAHALCDALLREGVDVIFGYPGGVVIPLYDVLPSYEPQLRHILTRHEQWAAHAAEGYARATGKVGVCLATSGRAQRTSLPLSPTRCSTRPHWWRSPGRLASR